jgi:hypothetical protein
MDPVGPFGLPGRPGKLPVESIGFVSGRIGAARKNVTAQGHDALVNLRTKSSSLKVLE